MQGDRITIEEATARLCLRAGLWVRSAGWKRPRLVAWVRNGQIRMKEMRSGSPYLQSIQATDTLPADMELHVELNELAAQIEAAQRHLEVLALAPSERGAS